MVLGRNPDNFSAETEQVAFCTAHIVPGLDFSNDPLLAGRIHSYVDTQISRLDGPPALSLFARPGDGNIATRRVAIFVADGCDGVAATALHAGLAELGAVPRYIGARLGAVTPEVGDLIEVEATFESMPSVLFDAAVVLDGKAAAVQALQADPRARCGLVGRDASDKSKSYSVAPLQIGNVLLRLACVVGKGPVACVSRAQEHVLTERHPVRSFPFRLRPNVEVDGLTRQGDRVPSRRAVGGHGRPRRLELRREYGA